MMAFLVHRHSACHVFGPGMQLEHLEVLQDVKHHVL